MKWPFKREVERREPPDPATSTETDRRVEPRQRSGIDAEVYFQPGNQSVSCKIINISDHGARIALKVAAELGDRVALGAPSGRLRGAHVRWRIGLEAGLEFID